MKIVTSSQYEIFDEYAFEGHLIKKSAFTCYKSEERSNKTTEQVIEMLKKNKHYAMFEFAWYPIYITPVKGDHLDGILKILKRFDKEKYLHCTHVNNGVLVSGNGRAWFECLKKDNDKNILSRSIYNFLNKINSTLFDSHDTFSSDEFFIQLLTKEEMQMKERTLNTVPVIGDESVRMKHDWFAVKFYGVSRGMTHELVRHRVMSFAQESSRYVTAKDFSFLVEDSALVRNTVDKEKLTECLKAIQETYNYFLNRGHKRDVARQLLPIGFIGDIVVAGNIEGWSHLFELRTDPKAHWEIRTVMNDLKKELNEKHNYSFKE
jgi:thymidylate synthase ThyX